MSDLTQRDPVVAAERRPGSVVSGPSFSLSQVLPWLIFAGLLTLVAM